MISCSPENFAYATGFVVPSQPLIRHRHAMVIVTADGETALFVVDMEATTDQAPRARRADARSGREFTDDAMIVLADQLKELGLAQARIGIEMDYLPAGDLARLQAALPRGRFERCEADRSRGCGRSRRRRRSRCCAACRASPTRRSPMRSHRCRRATREMDIAGAPDAQRLCAGRRALQADDRRDRRAQPACRTSALPSARLQARRRLPRRDLLGDRRLSGGRVPHRRRAARRRRTPSASGSTSSTASTRSWTWSSPARAAARSTTRSSPSSRSLNLPPISFVGHGIGLHLHEDPYLGKTPILGSRARCAARRGHGARLRAALLRDRPRLRHAEQGHAARDRRPAASSCPTTRTPTSCWSSKG